MWVTANAIPLLFLNIPNYKKIMGTVGILHAAARVPGVLNQEEICSNCKNPPGSEGCTALNKERGCSHSIPQGEHERAE